MRDNDSTVSVQTVRGPVRSNDLGFTLPHEHLINNIAAGGLQPDPNLPALFDTKVSPAIAWQLNERPYACKDNCKLDSHEEMLSELENFSTLGGVTVVELTPRGQGQDKNKLALLSSDSGVNIIAGGGWYLERFHPESTEKESVDTLASTMLKDSYLYDPEDPKRILSGVIGEIGVSPQFTAREIKALRSACIMQRETGLPLYIHLPGFLRLGNRVLDVVINEQGVAPEAVVLCHVDPSGSDPDYQRSLAERGVWLEFDMIGMPYRFTLPGEGQAPAVEQTVWAVRRLFDSGFGNRLLFSHDLFLKGMLRANGGNGLGYIKTFFLERLVDSGVSLEDAMKVNTKNVRELFEVAQSTK